MQNPADGMIVTANQDLNHLGDANPINAPMGDYRATAHRPTAWDERDDHDVDSFRAIQFDTYSIQAAEFLESPHAPAGSGSSSPTRSAPWDRRYEPDSTLGRRRSRSSTRSYS